MENVNPESTTSMEEQTTIEPVTEETAQETAPEETVQGNEETEQNTEQPVEESSMVPPEPELPFLSVRYNHEKRDMTREQAVEFTQKGLLYDKISPIYNKLDYLAAQNDMTASEMIQSLLDTAERAQREELVDKFGEDEKMIDEMMEFYRSRTQEKYDKILADRSKAEEQAVQEAREQRETRLSEQFLELQKEFPEIKEFSELPENVKQIAAQGKMELTAAYLLHKHRESKRIAAAEQSAAIQSKASTGTVQSEEIADSASVDAFIRGVHGN